MNAQPVLLFVHISSVAIWVGGMFFAYVCLRPTAMELFEPPQRLRLWRGVFARFFSWVWLAVTLTVASGLIMFGQRGLVATPLNWHLMLAGGTVMIVIFIYVFTRPYAVLKQAVEDEEWKTAGAALNRIRQMVRANLVLGLVTIGSATLGRYLVG